VLDFLDAANEVDAREDRPLNTRIAYATDWAVWAEFCDALRVPAVTARAGLFRTFVKWLEEAGRTPATIQRRLAGVITCLRDQGLAIPEKGGPAALAWDRVRAYEAELRQRNITLGRGPSPAFGRVLIRQVCPRLPVGLTGLRDKLIVLLGYAIAARQSETAAMLGTDITTADGGIEVHVRHTKGGRQRVVPVTYAEDPQLCPVRTWFAWQRLAGITDGPVVCQLAGRVNIKAVPQEPIAPKLVTARLHEVAKLLDESRRVTGQSLRAGRVTDLHDDGVAVADICAITGHSPKSGTVYDYVRRETLWRNPAIGLGL
jgi:site-specific recombinase XerD